MELLTVVDLAEWLRCSRQTIYRRIWDGTLRPVKIGGLLRFKRSDCLALIEHGA